MKDISVAYLVSKLLGFQFNTCRSPGTYTDPPCQEEGGLLYLVWLMSKCSAI